MIGLCIRVAVWMGIATSAIFVALPACVLLLWVAIVSMWLLGLLGLVRFLLRLWNPKLKAMLEERRQQRSERKEAKRLLVMRQESYGESRFLLVQQYLEDQLNTLSQHLLHIGSSGSLDADVGGSNSCLGAQSAVLIIEGGPRGRL